MKNFALKNPGRPVLYGAASLGILGFLWWSLSAFSTFDISQSDLWAFVANGEVADDVKSQVIGHIRLPRALAALFVGGLLAMAGMLMQGVSRNPLASPTMLGVTGGASLGLAVVSSGILSFEFPFDNSVAAIVGGALAWGIVFVLGAAWSAQASRARLVLAGITVAALCASLTRLVVLLAEERAQGVLNWLAGSLVGIRWPEVQILAVVFVLSLICCLLLANQFNLMNLGDESAQSLGVRLRRLRIMTFVLGTITVGVTVAYVGPIGFIGLMAPNIARLLVGVDYRSLTIMSTLLGGLLLLLSDIIARWVAFPAETAAGAVTALIGAPFFLIMARRLK